MIICDSRVAFATEKENGLVKPVIIFCQSLKVQNKLFVFLNFIYFQSWFQGKQDYNV